MVLLDSSQQAFCDSNETNIRLLAPAGCGKTSSLLHRCRSLVTRGSSNPRFLIITFTNAAAEEIKDRQANDPDFECLKDRITVNTLNAYGWRRIRNRVSNAQLLNTATKRHFAMLNQLRPAWLGNQHIEPVVKARGRNTRTLMSVMDNLKSMGFDHTVDTNLENFKERIRILEEQGASWRIDEQFDLLTGLGILDSRHNKRPSETDKRTFYNRFFTFWRDATSSLLDQSTFTFEDQKY